MSKLKLKVFRVDASLKIGAGHVMRCLTLADALRQEGHECLFICRKHEGNLIAIIEKRGFPVFVLPMTAGVDSNLSHSQWLGATQLQDAKQCIAWFVEKDSLDLDWLIVDHYALDKTWEECLRPYAKRLMAIDDLADRKHDCELLLDQNLGRKAHDYQGFVPNHCQLLIGPKYALLRPEFAQWREYSLKRRQKPELKTLLISLGGVDKNNVTGQVLTVLKNAELPQDIEITVVMGVTAPHLADVQIKSKRLPCRTEVLVNVKNMAELMANTDLAIGAAGSSSWERCCLGLPTVMLELADNQKGIAKALVNVKAALSMELNSFNIPSYEELTELTENSSTLCDGTGDSKVMSTLTKLSHHK